MFTTCSRLSHKKLISTYWYSLELFQWCNLFSVASPPLVVLFSFIHMKKSQRAKSGEYGKCNQVCYGDAKSMDCFTQTACNFKVIFLVSFHVIGIYPWFITSSWAISFWSKLRNFGINFPDKRRLMPKISVDVSWHKPNDDSSTLISLLFQRLHQLLTRWSVQDKL